MGRAKGTGRQLTKPETPTKDEMADAIEPLLEERGMPEEKASERARNAAKRIRTSKQTGKRIDAKPSRKEGATRPSSPKPKSPQKEAEEQLSKPTSENAYTPASPYRKKKPSGGKK